MDTHSLSTCSASSEAFEMKLVSLILMRGRKCGNVFTELVRKERVSSQSPLFLALSSLSHSRMPPIAVHGALASFEEAMSDDDDTLACDSSSKVLRHPTQSCCLLHMISVCFYCLRRGLFRRRRRVADISLSS